MRDKVSYEWTVEEIDEFDDIVEVHFVETRDEAIALRDSLIGTTSDRLEVGLVRHAGNELDGENERHYAYLLEDGTLPEVFSSCSREGDGPPVPQRFLKQPA